MLIASGNVAFQIPQLGLEGANLVARQAQQELHASHARQFRGAPRGEPSQLVELDRRQDLNLARESLLVGLLGQEDGLGDLDDDVPVCHAGRV